MINTLTIILLSFVGFVCCFGFYRLRDENNQNNDYLEFNDNDNENISAYYV